MKLTINELQKNNSNFIMKSTIASPVRQNGSGHELQKSDSNIVSKTNSKNSRKNNYSLVVVALLIISVLNFSCSKPENGTNGTNGVDGKNGTNGEVGTTGPAGSANVIYSDWTTVIFAGTSPDYSCNIIAPAITQNILDRGTVIVFSKSSNNIYPVPYLYPSSSTTYYIQPAIRLGNINLYANITYVNVFRYIIIPSGVPSGRGTTITRPNYNQMTYSQVCAKYNIPE